MGDPVVDIWTAYPEEPAVSHADPIAAGANSTIVTVETGGEAIENALVCAMKGTETYATGYTDANGRVELAFGEAVTAGDLLLTVSKHNVYPYQATIPVATQNVYVGFIESDVDDDQNGASSGNEDGKINPGETIELGVQVRNYGFNAATGVLGTLTCDDPYVTIEQPTALFGTVAAGAAVWSANSLVFSLDNACPHDHLLRFGLEVSAGGDTWHSLIELDAVSADLVATATTLYNHGGNGRLDPGETVELSVELTNNGDMDAEVVMGAISTSSPYIVIGNGSASFGNIAIGATGENTGDLFSITASSTTFEGHLATFDLITEFSGGVTDTTHFELTVGLRSTNDPVGPDLYGYLAYDDTDTAYPEAPVYDWVELDPAYGGDGTEIVLGDYGGYQDRSRIVDIPFTFRYYGEEYVRATVCSNGWVAMGDTYLTNYRNWTIPSSGGPDAMVAPFWDNLYQSSGSKAYQKYDVANHRWIIECSRFRNDYNGATETFEVIFYDPAHHPTESGDGIIEFQYQQVTNYDPTNGYATVGIENADQSDGLLYTYWNIYSGGAATLTSGRAIRFMPSGLGQTAGVGGGSPDTPLRFSLAQNEPNPFNPVTTITYALPADGQVKLEVFNVRGQLVETLVDGAETAGVKTVVWAASEQASGIYFYRLSAGEKQATRKMVLLQ
jgi:hypothetical protein